jgi:hypothetical protein
MNRTLKIGTGIAVGAAAVAVAGMMATASPVTTSLVAADPTPSASADAQKQGGHAGETPLTGDDATKATAAAMKAEPDGTVIRVETDSDGVYEAHVRKADGTEVVVKMDAGFTVTAVEEFQGRGGRGGGIGGGHRGGGREGGTTDDDASPSSAPSA